MQIQPILGYFWAIFGLYQPSAPPFWISPPPPFYISWIRLWLNQIRGINFLQLTWLRCIWKLQTSSGLWLVTWYPLTWLVTLSLETPDFIRPLHWLHDTHSLGLWCCIWKFQTSSGLWLVTWPIRDLMKSGVSRRNVAKWVAKNLFPVIDLIIIWHYISTGWIIYINIIRPMIKVE